MKTDIKTKLIERLENRKAHSAWDKGVKQYAIDMIAELEEVRLETLRDDLLNGASDWREYSYGGCALIYDADIAEQLCNPSELQKTRNGERQPNARETWLDVQARALFHAERMILSCARFLNLETV